jgi:transposase InsO family protein
VASVGSRGDSYDNALAESFIGLFKTELGMIPPTEFEERYFQTRDAA